MEKRPSIQSLLAEPKDGLDYTKQDVQYNCMQGFSKLKSITVSKKTADYFNRLPVRTYFL